MYPCSTLPLRDSTVPIEVHPVSQFLSILSGKFFIVLAVLEECQHVVGYSTSLAVYHTAP